VTTPQDIAVLDAVKALNMFLLPNINIPILGIVENMAWFTPKELPNNKYYIFGKGGGEKLAKMADTSVLAQIPLVQGIRESGDTGHQEGVDTSTLPIFDKMGQELIKSVEWRNKHKEATKIVEVQ
ncbi:MAG TPA: P-loop NTPase, partial [Saprospiraceae bacterium]|nr:P-loop NTPase [Saprospiraceae bacterium]